MFPAIFYGGGGVILNGIFSVNELRSEMAEYCENA